MTYATRCRQFSRFHCPYDNRRNETMYLYTDTDTQLQQLVGTASYAIAFPKGQLPPVKGFWSLTMYNPAHFFAPNALKRYALGTKNGKFSIWLRAYWPDQAILDGTWKPPVIAQVK